MGQTGNRAKLLIVDDNRQNIEILMDLFKDEYRVTAALNGARALKVARSESPPDLILMDIIMPDMDGYEVCALLKQDQAAKNIPIIFVTAVSEVMDAARGFDMGAVDYITKPFHPPVVQARVKLHLELKRKQELLEEYAFLDSLTEIPNRRRFEETMEREWNRALRSQRPVSLIFFDIDHFKNYNDTYGHGQGDTCLRRLAQTAAGCLHRAGDFVARYGGEEFAVLLPYSDQEAAMKTAEHLGKALDDLAIPHKTSPVESYVTVSMGVVTALPRQGLTPSQLMEQADHALYAAKNGGRHRIEAVEF